MIKKSLNVSDQDFAVKNTPLLFVPFIREVILRKIIVLSGESLSLEEF